MKKRKQYFLIAISAIMLITLVGLKVNAETKLFYLSIPRAQGWSYTDDERDDIEWSKSNGNGYITGDAGANHSTVYVSGLNGVSSVTFYAGAWQNNGNTNFISASSGTVYAQNQSNSTINAYYGVSYAKGQKVGLRVRNHNWSVSSGSVSGTVDYH